MRLCFCSLSQAAYKSIILSPVFSEGVSGEASLRGQRGVGLKVVRLLRIASYLES